LFKILVNAQERVEDSDWKHLPFIHWRRREREWSCQTRNKRTSTEY